MSSLTSAVLTTLTACLVVAPGLAQATVPADAARSITVRYADLNLATEQGTAALYARLLSAAREVCSVGDTRDLAQIAAARTCEVQAVASAVRDVHSPRLSPAFTAHPRHG